ncbi:DUF4974 domain-containing protein [Pedobacter sp. HMF7647]|uniref:DUF4974 domain-containing protein n=1 Tax=Hufsiella arboris TaxID=2695275 RepID=A0A7K1YB95_9SPHI|nr:FecR family protein [Hufsiella arboris]MXV51846.1 DUF4974 domain-containing protein [Hufsiella arboris]
MTNNNFQEVEDYLLDDSFIEWVLGNSRPNEFWNDYLKAFPQNEEKFHQACIIAKSLKIKPEKDLSQSAIDRMVSNFEAKTSKKNFGDLINFWNFRPFRIAAAIILFCSAGYISYVLLQPANEQKSQTAFQRIKNNQNKSAIIKLPDGSLAVLQPNAQIIYPKTFDSRQREVNLIGEAFFEVTKNPNKPFYVFSKEMTVRVVGTSFNVKANEDTHSFEVLVSTGRVEVFAGNLKNRQANTLIMVLMPNQHAVLDRRELRLKKDVLAKPVLLSEVSTAIHFKFSQTPFPTVISTIEKAYGIHILYDEAVMKNCQVTASLVRQSLDERLKLICKAIEADYKYVNGQVIIEGKGCGNEQIDNTN